MSIETIDDNSNDPIDDNSNDSIDDSYTTNFIDTPYLMN